MVDGRDSAIETASVLSDFDLVAMIDESGRALDAGDFVGEEEVLERVAWLKGKVGSPDRGQGSP